MPEDFERELDIISGKLIDMAEELPKQAVAKAARAGSSVALKQIRNRAPIRSGALRAGIIQHKERTKVNGKAVYDIMMDPKKNSIFQKPIANPVRCESNKGYYPASMEYGYFRRKSGGGLKFVSESKKSAAKGDRVEGRYFMRMGAMVSESASEGAIVKALTDEIDKIWR